MTLRVIATLEVLLVLPAVFFLTAILVRYLPWRTEIAHGAEQIVTWYAVRIWTLWALLVTLPLLALLTGCASLLQQHRKNTYVAVHTYMEPQLQVAHLLIAGSTVAAGLILVVIGLHILAN